MPSCYTELKRQPVYLWGENLIILLTFNGVSYLIEDERGDKRDLYLGKSIFKDNPGLVHIGYL